MVRWIAWSVVAVVLLLVILFGAGLILFYSTDWNKQAATIAAEISAFTGRETKIRGDIKLGLFPPRLVVNDVGLANAPWGSQPEMFTARHIDVSISYAGLFRGEIELDLTLDGSDLLFERNKNGVSNWNLERTRPVASAPVKESTALPFRITRLDLRQVVVTTRLASRKAAHRYTFDELLLSERAWPVVDVKLFADINGSPVRLVGVIHDIDELLRGRAPTPIDVEGDVAGARVQGKGSIADVIGERVIDATLSAQLDDLPMFGKLIGMDLPAWPLVKLHSRVREKNLAFDFSKFSLSVGESSLEGNWALDLRPDRPRFRGVVHASSVDLPQLRLPDEAQRDLAPRSAKRRVFPDTPWPTDALRAVDVHLEASVAQLQVTPKLVMRDIRAALRLRNGRLSLDPLTLPAVGGALELRMSLATPIEKPAQLMIAAKGDGLDLGRTLNVLGVEDFVIGGPTQLAVNLKGHGETPAAVMEALNGYVRIVVGSGRVKNSTLLEVLGGIFQTVLKALNPFQEKAPYSELQCLVVNVPVRNGVVMVEHNVAFETDQVGVSSAGAVNLGKEEIDLAIKPKAKSVLDVGLTDIAGMVRVRGPWSDAKVEVDPEGTAKSITRLWIDIATGGATWLADRLIFTPFVLDAPCKAALKGDASLSEAGDNPVK